MVAALSFHGLCWRSRRKSVFTASKKNPAEAGFSTHYRVDHSAGTMFEAWAPFGPWVTS